MLVRNASESRIPISGSSASAGALRSREAVRRAPAGDASRQRREVTREQGVAENDRRLGDERPHRVTASQHAVAAQQVAAREARVASLPGRAVSVCGGAEVDSHRLGRHGCAPAGAAQAQRQVEVLRVGKDRLVEPADLAPRGAPVCRRGPGRPREPRPRISGPRDRQARQARKTRERAVGAQPDAVDRLLPGLHEQARDRARPGLVLQRRDQALEPVGSAVHIVVQQHHHLAIARIGAAVAGGGEAQPLCRAEQPDRGPLAADPLGGLLAVTVVGDDHRMWAGLPRKMREAVARQVIVPRGRDHDVDC